MRLIRRGKKESPLSRNSESYKCWHLAIFHCWWDYGGIALAWIEDIDHRLLGWALKPERACERIRHAYEPVYKWQQDYVSSIANHMERCSASLVYWLAKKLYWLIHDSQACFGAQYVTNKPHHLTMVSLANIWQDEDESLRDFMERFSLISVWIQD